MKRLLKTLFGVLLSIILQPLHAMPTKECRSLMTRVEMAPPQTPGEDLNQIVLSLNHSFRHLPKDPELAKAPLIVYGGYSEWFYPVRFLSFARSQKGELIARFTRTTGELVSAHLEYGTFVTPFQVDQLPKRLVQNRHTYSKDSVLGRLAPGVDLNTEAPWGIPFHKIIFQKREYNLLQVIDDPNAEGHNIFLIADHIAKRWVKTSEISTPETELEFPKLLHPVWEHDSFFNLKSEILAVKALIPHDSNQLNLVYIHHRGKLLRMETLSLARDTIRMDATDVNGYGRDKSINDIYISIDLSTVDPVTVYPRVALNMSFYRRSHGPNGERAENPYSERAQALFKLPRHSRVELRVKRGKQDHTLVGRLIEAIQVLGNPNVVAFIQDEKSMAHAFEVDSPEIVSIQSSNARAESGWEEFRRSQSVNDPHINE